MCAGLEKVRGKNAHLMQYCCDSIAAELEIPQISMFTDYKTSEHSKYQCQLSSSQIKQIVEEKCFGTEVN